MPRTKISKNSKRNRQATNEELVERLKDVDTKSEQFIYDIDLKLKEILKSFTAEFVKIRNRLPETILSMKFGDFVDLDVNTIDDFKDTCNSTTNSKLTTINSTSGFNRKVSKDDEGTNIKSSNVISSVSTPATTTTTTSSSSSQSSGIVLGPLNSAKARGRHRRSRSACTYFAGDNIYNTQNGTKSSKLKNGKNDYNNDHGSQMRTMSADRARPITPKITPNTPLSIIRYPRLGETVISLSGSPVVAQGQPDSTANVNIPLKNGVISLRPTKMDNVDRNIITQIDEETLYQIKQLQTNLNMIMNFASKDIGL